MQNMRCLTTLLALLLSSQALAQVRPRITADELKADVSFLASDVLQGRGTPSPGLDVAAEYIASAFRRAGLTPAGDDGYFQTAGFETVTPVIDGLELSLEVEGTVLKADKSAVALQEPVALDLNRAPVVKIQLGDSAGLDSLTAEQVRGKVLLGELKDEGAAAYGAVRRLYGVLAKLEPSLVIIVRKNAAGTVMRERLRETSSSASRIPILVVWDPAFRSAVTGAREAGISAHIPAPAMQAAKLRNVIGIQRGSDPALKDTYLVVSAHYDHLGVRGAGAGDHIYNGANDDASGTAAVIESARALALLPEKPKRSVVYIAFFGEEAGELGSKYYCRHPVFPLAATIADINLEQLGRTDDLEGTRLLQFNLTGFDYTDLAVIFQKAAAGSGVKVVKHEKNSDLFFAASDNAAFAELGIPSTTISVAYIFPDYHKPGDEWPKINYENMAEVSSAIALGISQLADSATIPRWNADNPKTARYLASAPK